MESLYEIINALSNGTIPDPYGLLFPKIGVHDPTQNCNCYYLRNGYRKLRTSNLTSTFTGSIRTKAL